MFFSEARANYTICSSVKLTNSIGCFVFIYQCMDGMADKCFNIDTNINKKIH